MDNLTLKEKVRLINGVGMWHTYDCNGKLQSIMMTDGPHGLRKQEIEKLGQNDNSKPATCFPTESAIACSWNKKMVEKMARTIAQEALAEKVSIVLGCGVNMKRSPLCGRNFEYFSEDPFLAGTLAIAYINAMQEMGVGTSLKHFAANNQETHRQTANSEVDERALREIYLYAFEMAVKNAKPLTVMASYNRINGVYACENKRLLNDILRDEWGYQGTVISDWGAAVDIPKCLAAGMDLEMPDCNGIHTGMVEDAIQNKMLDMKHLDRAVENVNKMLNVKSDKNTECIIDYDKHHEIAEELELESAVLLKNDGFYPIEEKEIIVIGDLAEHMRFQGGGSSHINPTKCINAIESLKKLGINVIYKKGYDSKNDKVNTKLEKEAIAAAKKGLPIIFFCGLTQTSEGEGYDRNTLSLPYNQLHLFERIYQVNHDIGMVTFGGSAFVLPCVTKVRAVLHMYLGGQAVGEACAKLLLGKVNPSGKLAETFPASLESVPSYLYFGKNSDDVEYRESIYIGYRYYDKYEKKVLFPFGHGLSYTTFTYKDLKISKQKYSGKELVVTFSIVNSGDQDGKEIVQLYVKNPDCNYLRAVKELKGYEKVDLKPLEEKEVTITLDERSFSIYDVESARYIMPSGNYQILIGASSRDIRLVGEIEVEGVEYDKDDRILLKDYFSKTEDIFQISREQFQILYGKELSQFDKANKGEFTIYDCLQKLRHHSFLAKGLLLLSNVIVRFIYPFKSLKDPEVMMTKKGIREGTLDSVICQGGGIIPYKMAQAIVLSANGEHGKAIKKIFGSKR